MSELVRRTSVACSAVIVAVLLLAPGVSRACAVCTAGRDEGNAFAFLMTTIFMSLMPLIAIGTLVYVLWRRIQKLEAEREDAAPRGAVQPESR